MLSHGNHRNHRKVKNTNDTNVSHTEITEITERYLTTDRTNNTDFDNSNEDEKTTDDTDLADAAYVRGDGLGVRSVLALYSKALILVYVLYPLTNRRSNRGILCLNNR